MDQNIQNLQPGMENPVPPKKNYHIKADMDTFNELMFKMEDMEDVTSDYFPNEEDMVTMETNPKKYLPFIIYLLSQNRELSESVLGREEAAFRKKSEKMMQEFINRHVELV